MKREYRDSIEWVGMTPNNWIIQKVKYIAETISKGNGITKEEVFDDGNIPCVRYGEIYSKYDGSFKYCHSLTNIEIQKTPRYVFKGNLLFAGTGELVEEIGKNIVYLGEEPCLAGGDIIVLSHHQNPVFLNYALNSYYTQAQKSRGKAKLKVVHISASEIGNIKILLPPLSEQQNIADYLDKVCGEIDEMVALQEQMIEELKAYKQSVIIEAVIKGINPNAPMRQSGIDWIGEIPSHWEVIRIKYLLDERKERSLEGLEEPLSMSQKYGLIPTKEMDMIPNMASSFIGAKLVYKGDLVFNKLKAHLGVFSVSEYEGLVSPDYAVYYPFQRADAKYLEYLFKTPQYIGEFIKLSSGVGAGLTRLYTSDLYSIKAILPPIDEQRIISSYIQQKSSEIDSLITIKQAKIEELKEYKKSIIYEYVTGKKEVV